MDYTQPDVWWSRYVASYDDRTWRSYQPLLGEVIRDAAGPPLLDVGCGIGFLVECARKFGIDAVGVEAATSALQAAAEQHPEADIRRWAAGSDLPIESESVGVAVLNEFVDHITLVQNRLLLGELHRVLRPGGSLVVRSPSRFNRHDEDLGHVCFFSPSEYRGLVESFAFEVLHQPFSPRPLLGRGRRRQLAMKAVAMLIRPERLAARIDLVARRR